MFRQTALLATVIVTGVLVACAGGSETAQTPSSASPAPSGTAAALPTADTAAGPAQTATPSSTGGQGTPVHVSIQREDDRTVRQLIKATEGGEITATAADGTQFTLRIPDDALPFDTEITLTPLASIDGLPFDGGLAGAVHLGPDGLRLLAPVILTLEPAEPAPLAEQVGFAASGTGEDLHLAPALLRDGRLEVQIVHFSVAGLAMAESMPMLTPASPLTTLQQEIAVAIGRAQRAAQEAVARGEEPPPFPPEVVELIEQALKQWESFVLQQLKRAETDCDLAPQVISLWLSVDKQRQVIGIAGAVDEAASQQAWASITKAIQNCEKEAWEELQRKCEARAPMEELRSLVEELLGYERIRQLHRLGGQPPYGDTGTLIDYVSKCHPRVWTGTVTYEEVRSESSRGPNGATDDSQSVLRLHAVIPDGGVPQDLQFGAAMLMGNLTGTYSLSSQWKAGEGTASHCRFEGERRGSGSLSAQAFVTIQVDRGAGTYQLMLNATTAHVPFEGRATSVAPGANCPPGADDSISGSVGPRLGRIPQGMGEIESFNVDALSGSHTETVVEPRTDSGWTGGTTITGTLSWDLKAVPPR